MYKHLNIVKRQKSWFSKHQREQDEQWSFYAERVLGLPWWDKYGLYVEVMRWFPHGNIFKQSQRFECTLQFHFSLTFQIYSCSGPILLYGRKALLIMWSVWDYFFSFFFFPPKHWINYMLMWGNHFKIPRILKYSLLTSEHSRWPDTKKRV